MTDNQENKLSMYLAVDGVLETHTAVWTGMTAFANAVTDFRSRVQTIRDTRLVQEGDTTGVTLDKAAAKETAITKAISVAAAVYAYASVAGNNTLKAQVDYSASELRKSRDTVLADRLQIIHDAANANIAVLGDYGITGTDVTELDGFIDAYFAQIQEPRNAIGNRSMATDYLKTAFRDADDVLKNRLDRLMELFTGQIVFYNQYKNARVIIDLGRGGGSSDTDPETPDPSLPAEPEPSPEI